MSNDFLTQRLFTKIAETEEAKRKTQIKWLTPPSLIKTTKEVAALAKNRIVLDDKPFIIKRNLKLDLFLWLVIICLMSGPLIWITDIKSNDINIYPIVIYSFLILLLLFSGYKNLTLKKLTSPIILTIKDITIQNEVFNWHDIQQTFYVYRPSSRSLFIIGLKNGQIQYFNINNQLGFRYNNTDFSKFIEHYRNYSF